LPKEDYDALSSKKFQLKYFDGGFVMDKEGPYKNYEDTSAECMHLQPLFGISSVDLHLYKRMR